VHEKKKFMMAPKKKRSMVNSRKIVPSNAEDNSNPNANTNPEQQREGEENPTQQEKTTRVEARVARNLSPLEIKLANLRQEAEELSRAKEDWLRKRWHSKKLWKLQQRCN
jgi:hypothetical protein